MKSFFALLLLGAGLTVLALPLAAQDAHEKETPSQAAPTDIQAAPAPPEPAMPPPPSKIAPPDIPMEAFGTASPDCMEWTDECRSCKRDAQNRVACSTPGIACIPGDISCTEKRK